MKRVPFVNRGYTKGVPFLLKMVFKRCKGLDLEAEHSPKKFVVFLSPRFHTTQIRKSSSLVPGPHYFSRPMRFGSRGRSSRILHRNALTAKAWEDAVRGDKARKALNIFVF